MTQADLNLNLKIWHTEIAIYMKLAVISLFQRVIDTTIVDAGALLHLSRGQGVKTGFARINLV